MAVLTLHKKETVLTLQKKRKKNVQIMFDNNLSMKDHISSLCRTILIFTYATRIESVATSCTLTTLHAVRSLTLKGTLSDKKNLQIT